MNFIEGCRADVTVGCWPLILLLWKPQVHAYWNLSVTAVAALSKDAYAMSHWLGVSTHALLLRPSNHIYAAAA